MSVASWRGLPKRQRDVALRGLDVAAQKAAEHAQRFPGLVGEEHRAMANAFRDAAGALRELVLEQPRGGIDLGNLLSLIGTVARPLINPDLFATVPVLDGPPPAPEPPATPRLLEAPKPKRKKKAASTEPSDR
jgi:hypothetical protein